MCPPKSAFLVCSWCRVAGIGSATRLRGLCHFSHGGFYLGDVGGGGNGVLRGSETATWKHTRMQLMDKHILKTAKQPNHADSKVTGLSEKC